MKIDEQKMRELLSRYIDGELSEEEIAQVQAYVKEFPMVQMELEKEKQFDALLRNHVHRESAPFAVRERVIERLEERRSVFGLRWLKNIPAPVLAGLCTLILGIIIFLSPVNTFPVFSESVSRHMEFLKGGLPVEIVSNDIDEVVDWFRGKVDFAVHVPDFSNSGLTLVGARLCHLKDKKVAYLIFEKQGHQLSLFVLDTQDMTFPGSKRTKMGSKVFYAKNHKGYRSILCLDQKAAGMGCVFVSDMPEDEMMELII